MDADEPGDFRSEQRAVDVQCGIDRQLAQLVAQDLELIGSNGEIDSLHSPAFETQRAGAVEALAVVVEQAQRVDPQPVTFEQHIERRAGYLCPWPRR